MKKQIALCLVSLACLSACSASENSTPTLPNNSNNTFSPVALTSAIESVQPMTGIVFWTENTDALDALNDTVQLEFSYMIYSDIVSEKGVYDWSVVDDILDEAAGRGHQAILRFRYSYPGQTKISAPNYIETSPDYNSTIAQVEGEPTYLPDWSFLGLEDFTLEFFTAFAARYDNDPRLAFLQVGFGSYAEYHLFDGPFSLGNNFPSKAFQTVFLNHLDQEFSNLHWSISIDSAQSERSPIAEDAGLLALEFGLFDDSFMHEEHSNNDTEYNRASWLTLGLDKYEISPFGGEFTYGSDFAQENVLNVNTGAYGKSFESFASQYNITYMIGDSQHEYQTAARIKDAAMATGYKFEIQSFTASAATSNLTIKNTGIAPIYYDAYPTVNGVRALNSLRELLPNTSMDFTVSSGGAAPVLTIESDRLVTGQTIQFDANL